MPTSQFYGEHLGGGTFRLASGEVIMPAWSNCCAELNRPASVYPSGSGWRSCDYPYYGSGTVTGVLSSVASSAVVIGGTVYNLSPNGAMGWCIVYLFE